MVESTPVRVCSGVVLILLALVTPQASGADAKASADKAGFDNIVQPFLAKHCIRCHGEKEVNGDVRLHGLSHVLAGAKDFDTWEQVLVQVEAGLMPPAKEPQPAASAKTRVIGWIKAEMFKSGRGDDYRRKQLHPSHGNDVDHDKLFSGEIKDAPFSPARLWRHSPYQFEYARIFYLGDPKREDRKTLSLSAGKGQENPLKKVTQPFSKVENEGIGDYAALAYADTATFDTLFRNAEYVVDRTLLMAQIELDYRSRGKTIVDFRAELAAKYTGEKNFRRIAADTEQYKRETPPVYKEIILGNGKPTQAQMEAAVKHHFERLGFAPPDAQELEKYVRVLREGAAQEGPYFGLRSMMIAAMVSPKYIYRSELGLGSPVGDGRTMLAPVELAYAIAYALTDRKPDDKLIEALKGGRLQTREDVKREVDRILDDKSIAKPRIMRFFHEFFGYNRAPEVFKDDERIAYDFAHYAGSLVKDADTLVQHILDRDKDVFRELLSTEKYFVAHDGDNARIKPLVDAHKKLYARFKDKEWLLPGRTSRSERKKSANDKSDKKEPELSKEELAYARSLHPDWKTIDVEGIKRELAFAHPFEQKGGTAFIFTGTGFFEKKLTILKAYNIDDALSWDYPGEQPFALAPGKRAGILSHPAWLMAHSQNAATDPVRRGKWIRERLLAGTVPDVPITVAAQLPTDTPHHTLRQKFAVTEKQECWKCHVRMNPLGYAFEVFDDFGRYRTRESLEDLPPKEIQKHVINTRKTFELKIFQTAPVDSRGRLEGTGDPKLDGDVKDAYDLIQRLAKSRRVQQSIIRHAFRYWMGRNEFLSDSRTLIAAEKAYMDNGGSFRAMLVSLLTSDSFLYRKHMEN